MSGPICVCLVLDGFREYPCPKNCKSRSCHYHHSQGDRRRSMRNSRYSRLMCTASGNCEYPNCNFAHSVVEQMYHPSSYKKNYCEFFYTKQCPYGEVCAFAHSDLEVRFKPIHFLPINLAFFFFEFKTEFCPFKIPHNKFTCLYAHNMQDFKRSFFPEQLPIQCPLWDREKKIDSFTDDCPNGLACNHCHGWKELEYHPARFRKLPCRNSDCTRKAICGFYHSEDEKLELEVSPFFGFVKSQLHYKSHTTQEYLSFLDIKEPEKFQTDSSSVRNLSQMSKGITASTCAENTPSKGELIKIKSRFSFQTAKGFGPRDVSRTVVTPQIVNFRYPNSIKVEQRVAFSSRRNQKKANCEI